MESEYKVTETPDPNCRMIRQLLLYKLDRTLAIIGIIILGGISIFETTSSPATIAAMGALGAYLGVKGGKQ